MKLSRPRAPLGKFTAIFAFAAAWLQAHPALAELGQPVPWGLGLQEHASPMKAKMAHLHNDILLPIAVVISVLVLVLLAYVMLRFNARANPVPSKRTHNVALEVIWTVVPVIILLCIVIPSMQMLYYVDRAKTPEMTLKVTGYQWYWGYEYPDDGGINFLSNLVPENELKDGQPRLLTTDNLVVLPIETDIQILTTASDVIHSWAVPSLGVKMDAVPGRTNETWVRIEKPGTYYGQCSELCGVNHGYMPIEVKAVTKEEFATWVKAQGGAITPKVKAGAAAETNTAGEAAANDKTGEAAANDKTGAASGTLPAQTEVKTPADAPAPGTVEEPKPTPDKMGKAETRLRGDKTTPVPTEKEQADQKAQEKAAVKPAQESK